MGFKESVDADIEAVFLNADEFAEFMDVKYDGTVYENIPVVLSRIQQTEAPTLVMERSRHETDRMNGVHIASAAAHIAQKDMRVVPEQDQWIYFRDGTAAYDVYWRRYRIITSDVELGMIRLELEAYSE